MIGIELLRAVLILRNIVGRERIRVQRNLQRLFQLFLIVFQVAIVIDNDRVYLTTVNHFHLLSKSFIVSVEFPFNAEVCSYMGHFA